jgi:hypothetical protein
MFSESRSVDNKKIGGQEACILLSILVFTIVLRIPTLLEPWGGDQGVYGYIASGILDGKVPYRDMYTNTGYGLYFIYALFFKLFGNQIMSLHIGDLLASLTNVAIVYFLARLLFGKECAIIAGAIAALFGSGQAFSGLYDMKGAWGTYWQLAQRETFMTPLIAAGIYLAIRSDRGTKWHLYFWVGILIGLAAVLKITAVAMLMILSVYIILNELFGSDGRRFKFILYKVSSLILGSVIIQLPFLYYFWINDSLSLMYNAVFVHTSIYAKLSRGNIVANAFQGNSYILLENLSLWVFSCAAMIHLMIHERKRENYLLVAWTMGALLMIFGQGKFFGYHYLLIVAPFSVLTGYGIKVLLKSLPTWKESIISARKNIVQIFMWVLLVTNLVVFAVNSYEYYRWNSLYLFGKISKDEYYEVFDEFPLHLYSFSADYTVAKYLQTKTKPGDTVRTINGGGDTIIHYLSGLRSPTRFTSTWYLFSKGLYDYSLTDQLRDEFIKEIKEEKPKYILLIYYNLKEFRKEFNGGNFSDIARMLDYIQKNYRLEKSFRDRRTLYKRIS